MPSSDISNFITAVATVAGGLVAFVGLWLVILQLRDTKRATLAQALWPVAMLLNDEKTRDARRVLLETKETDLSKWTADQRAKAEVACNAYDIAAIMLKRLRLKHDLVTAEWGYSIIDCWERSKPIREERREHRPGYWDDFEWLVTESRKTLAPRSNCP